MLLLYRGLPRAYDGLCRYERTEAECARCDSGLPCGRPRSEAVGHLPAEPGAAPLCAAQSAGDDYAAELAGARADVQGPAGAVARKGPGDHWIPGLSGA